MISRRGAKCTLEILSKRLGGQNGSCYYSALASNHVSVSEIRFKEQSLLVTDYASSVSAPGTGSQEFCCGVVIPCKNLRISVSATKVIIRKGDFHAALNFAAVLEAQVLFICRNNGWAISTPVADQLRSDGIAAKGQAYGVRSIRVDGNDALAVYDVISAARKMAIEEQRPILIEALTYRVGHHSTSDDSTRYRPIEEIELWKNARDPVTRFRKWIERNDWWNEINELELQTNVRMQVATILMTEEHKFRVFYQAPTVLKKQYVSDLLRKK